MPKFCVNYLMEIRDLFAENYEHLDFIDYIKLYSINGDLSPFDWCVSKRNVMFHGMINGGSSIANSKYFEGRNIELQKDYFKRGNTPYMSLHIDRNEECIGEDETFKVISKNIQKLKEIFKMRLILENVPARRKTPETHFLSMPEFISKVVKENDCGFLFDIGHARSAAETLKIPFEEYVSRLPMDRVIELHLAGSMVDTEGRIRPNHSKMREADYEFLKDALRKYPTIETVTLEYGPLEPDELSKPYELIEPCVIVNALSSNDTVKEEVKEQISRIKEIMK